MPKYCKLSDYAKRYGVTYRTAFNRFNAGKIEGAIRDKTGHICVPIEYIQNTTSSNVVIYATAISNKDEHIKKLNEQISTIKKYCNAKGYQVTKVVTEIASTIMSSHPKLIELLKDNSCKHIVIDNPATISRFSFDIIRELFESCGKEIEAMNNEDSDKNALREDFVKVIYNVCKTLNNHKIPKKNIMKLIDNLSLNTEESKSNAL